MSPQIFLLFFFLSSLLPFDTAVAQDEREPDRVALRQLGARYEEAINRGDLHVLGSSVSATASAVFSTNVEVKGLEAMQNYFLEIRKRLGSGSSYSVKLRPDTTQFFGDIALAHGKSDEVARLGNGREFRFVTHWTALLRKDGGNWKAERLHVSMDPIENAIVLARQQQRTWWAAGLGMAASLLAYAFGRRSGRSERPEERSGSTS